MLIFSCASFFRGSLPVDHLFVWYTDRPAGEGLQALRGRASCAQVSPCLADPQKLRGVQLETPPSRPATRCGQEAARSRSPAQIPTWLLVGPADEAKKLAIQQQDPGRRVADPSSPLWWPDIPLRGDPPEEGDSSAFFAAGPGRHGHCHQPHEQVGSTEAVQAGHSPSQE